MPKHSLNESYILLYLPLFRVEKKWRKTAANLRKSFFVVVVLNMLLPLRTKAEAFSDIFNFLSFPLAKYVICYF